MIELIYDVHCLKNGKCLDTRKYRGILLFSLKKLCASILRSIEVYCQKENIKIAIILDSMEVFLGFLIDKTN